MAEEKKEDTESAQEESVNEPPKTTNPKQAKDGIKFGKWSREEHKDLLKCTI
jgi:hypothetical protein